MFEEADRVVDRRVSLNSSFHFQTFLTRSFILTEVTLFFDRLVDADDELASSSLPWQPLLYLVADRGPSSDAGVRLTAAVALRQCMDLWELDPIVFTPYVRPTWLSSFLSFASK